MVFRVFFLPFNNRNSVEHESAVPSVVTGGLADNDDSVFSYESVLNNF